MTEKTLLETGMKIGGSGKDYPPFWNFYPRMNDDGTESKAHGDYIEGTITDIREMEGAFGLVPVIQIKIANGAEYTVWCSQTTLKNKINASHADVGGRIGIKYNGKQKNPKSGRTFYAFDVVVPKK